MPCRRQDAAELDALERIEQFRRNVSASSRARARSRASSSEKLEFHGNASSIACSRRSNTIGGVAPEVVDRDAHGRTS